MIVYRPGTPAGKSKQDQLLDFTGQLTGSAFQKAAESADDPTLLSPIEITPEDEFFQDGDEPERTFWSKLKRLFQKHGSQT